MKQLRVKRQGLGTLIWAFTFCSMLSVFLLSFEHPACSAYMVLSHSINHQSLSTNSLFIASTEEKKEDIKKEDKKEEKKAKEEKKEKKKEPINEKDFEPVSLGKLLESPKDYLNKKIKIRGKFSSFTTLALDYEPALRKSKDYLSICIFRPDRKIPLSELKLAYPIKEAKDNIVIRELEENDVIEIFGEVFSAALDEPWVDILSIKKIESATKKDDKKPNDKTNKSSKNKTLKNKEKKELKINE